METPQGVVRAERCLSSFGRADGRHAYPWLYPKEDRHLSTQTPTRPSRKDMFRSPILRNPKTDASRDDSPFPVDRVLGADIAPIDTAVGTPEPPCWSHILRPMPSRLSEFCPIHVSHDLAIISPNLATEP